MILNILENGNNLEESYRHAGQTRFDEFHDAHPTVSRFSAATLV